MISASQATDFLLVTATVIAGIAASGKMIQMTDEVNRRLPAEDRHQEVFWYPGQLRRVATAHRLFYPHSRLRNSRNFLLGLTLVLFVTWLVVSQLYF